MNNPLMLLPRAVVLPLTGRRVLARISMSICRQQLDHSTPTPYKSVSLNNLHSTTIINYLYQLLTLRLNLLPPFSACIGSMRYIIIHYKSIMPSKRLKHFCQLCRKQCKDENGFKCHINSESHQMRVREFAINPLEHIEKAFREFEWRFIQMIKVKYPGQPKYLEELYNQLIEEKKFLKFNHTQWKNLTEFGNYLQNVKNLQVIGSPPNCKVVYIVNKTKDFIDATKKEKLQAERQREKEQVQKSLASRIERERQLESKRQKQLNQQLIRLQEEGKHMVIPQKLQFNISGFNTDNKRSALYTVQDLEREVKDEMPIYQRKMNNIQKLYQELKKQNQGQEEQQQEIEWIKPGITVRIKPHEIDPAFHNKKCKISKIVEPFVAGVEIGTALIDIDQTYLQTVIPKIGHKVMILVGKKIGEIGVLREANLSQGYGIVQCKQQKVKVSFNLFSRYDQ